MRAIHQTELGGPEVLRLIDRPRQAPGPTEVLVRVTAAGVNPLDWKTQARGAFLGAPPFTVGGDTAVRSLPALRDGGILIGVLSGTATAEVAARRRVRATYLLVEPDHRGLEAIAALFDAGRLAVHVSHTFPLTRAADAHRMGESGHVQGKLVLMVGS